MKIVNKIKDFFDNYKIFLIIIFVIIVVIFITIFLILFNNKKEENIIETNKISYEEEIKEEPLENIYYYVDIKGEVNNPGVYKLDSNSRVIDAINAAGGLKDNSSTRYINLSKFIADEMVIIVYSNEEINEYKKTETIVIPCECEEIINDSCLDNNVKHNEEDLININIATQEELMTISGIGEAKANAIINYREIKQFDSIEEIKEVSGISDALYDKIKNFITV